MGNKWYMAPHRGKAIIPSCEHPMLSVTSADLMVLCDVTLIFMAEFSMKAEVFSTKLIQTDKIGNLNMW